MTTVAHERAFDYEQELIRAITALLRSELRLGVKQLAAAGRHVLEAEIFPEPPDHRRVLLVLEAAAKAVADPILAREQVTAAARQEPSPPPLTLSFSVSNPLVRRLLDEFGLQITQVTDGERRRIVEAAREAYAAGLSIPDAASIMETVAATEARATMIARTMLIGAANGASVAAVRMVDGAPYKTWLATIDSRCRPEHLAANGQTVPIDKPFNIGGYMLQYPGDPSGPADLVINCRCTVTYADQPGGFVASSGGSDAESMMARMAASGSTTLPLSERDHGWDAGAAQKRLSPAQYADAHFWRDPEGDPATLAAYKLPFADIINGRLTAVWRGVTAGAQRLSQTQIPSSDVAGVQSKMAAYYRKAASKYGDPSITPPWSASAAILPPNHDYKGMGGPCALCGMMEDDPVHTVLTAALDGIAWHAILALEGVPTSDGRLFDVGALDWRDPPLTLYGQFENSEGHDDAPIVGRIDSITRVVQGDTAMLHATGVFDSGDAGQTAARLVGDRSLNGISIDFGIHAAEIIDDVGADGEVTGGTMRIASATVYGATLVGMPAFAEAMIALTADAGRATLQVPITMTLTRTRTVEIAAKQGATEPSIIASVMAAASEAIAENRERDRIEYRANLEAFLAMRRDSNVSQEQFMSAVTAAITAASEPVPVHLHAAPITVEAAPAPNVHVAAPPPAEVSVTVEPALPANVTVEPAQIHLTVPEQGPRLLVRDEDGTIIGSEPAPLEATQ